MKKSTLIISSVLASMTLVGCNHYQPQQEYVVVQESAPQPVPLQAVTQPMVSAANCCPQQVPVQQPQQLQPTMPQQPMLQPTPVAQYEMPKPKPKKTELMKITGIGYGAQSTYQAYTPGQRRLMAIRSSKLDAYRALAEQIYGIKIDSNTSVATLTAKNDSFRARVNAVVRGARVVSVTPMADNNYETVLEVYVDKAFFEKAFVYSGEEEDLAIEPESMYRFRSLR